MPAVPELPNNVTALNGTHRVSPTSSRASSAARPAADPTANVSDSVEISRKSTFLSLIRQPTPIRQDLVDQTRSAIQDDAYLTDARIDGAIDEIARDQSEIG